TPRSPMFLMKDGSFRSARMNGASSETISRNTRRSVSRIVRPVSMGALFTSASASTGLGGDLLRRRFGLLVPLLQVLFHLEPRNGVGRPLRCRRSLQIVVDPLLHADGVVPLVRTPGETVVLADVLKHDDRLPHPPQRVVVLDALREVDGAVAIVVQ